MNLGRKGEKMALQNYLLKGYKLVKSNFQYYSKGVMGRIGEIDLIVKKQNIIIFVEVKTRSNGKYGHILSQISDKKINCLSLASQKFIYEINNNFEEFLNEQKIDKTILSQNEVKNIQYQFDLAMVQNGKVEVIKNFIG